MLVLTRKVGESIAVGENCRMFVKAIDGGKVILSFDAPRDVRIHRGELRDRLDAERERPPVAEAACHGLERARSNGKLAEISVGGLAE